MKLIFGNKNYSSWSLRPWLLLHANALDFEEELVFLSPPDIKQTLSQYSPTSLVPVLKDNNLTIWDSLAICEYVNDTYLNATAWPKETASKSLARSITCQVHSGFSNIKAQLPMNIHATRNIVIDQACKDDIQQLDNLLNLALQKKSETGNYLLGDYGIVDCFLTPLASRFNTYQIKLSEASQAYFESLLAHPSFLAWQAAAALEDDYIWQDEKGDEA